MSCADDVAIASSAGATAAPIDLSTAFDGVMVLGDASASTVENESAPLPQDARDVLTFWFDGEQTENHRSKWFPPDASEKQRRMDALITERFSALLQRAERGELEQQQQEQSDWTQQRLALVALIVVLDQFSRHVYRANTTSVVPPQQQQRIANDAHALRLAQLLVARNWHVALDVPHFVFALMPLRHSPTPARLRSVLEAVDVRTTRHVAHADLLDKFRRTTQNRLLHLPGASTSSLASTNDTVDAALLAASDADILERPLVETDERDLPQHRLFKAMHAFLSRMDAQSCSHMAVSLSGGVDSMVVAYLLHKLRPLHGNYAIVAAHLDYANRAESAAESAYVDAWCKRFDIAFVARRIDEVQRATTKRDDYERITRDIRYALYADVMAQTQAPGMCFGHHRGDVQENVISNVMKGTSLLNLNGMSDVSVVNNVCIWRPLLAFDKDAILDFAHRYGVPYFKDTTPLWSTRGKLRTQLLPLLAELYGDGFLQNVSTLGAESVQCSDVVESRVLAPILASVQTSHVAVWLDCTSLVSQPFFVWKEVVRAVCHSIMGTSMVREKPLRELMAKLARHAGRPDDAMWITLKKTNRAFITQQRTLVIFRDRFFQHERQWPPHCAVAAGNHLFRFQPGETLVFGAWTITTTLVDRTSDVVVSLRDRAPLTMMDVVAANGVAYVLPPTRALTLSSEKRLAVLKRLEKPLTDYMPLVAAVSCGGADDDDDDEATANATTKWVYVQLQYNDERAA